MLPSFANTPVVRVRPTALPAGGHNNKSKPDWSNVNETTIDGCSAQPGSTQEVLDNRDSRLVLWTVFMPPDADVVATDGIRLHGTLYAINGEPKRWPSATGGLDHIELELKLWEG